MGASRHPSSGDEPGHGAEAVRLASDPAAWQRWGPYLSERAWGSVREDYSPAGDAWTFFPHEHARSRAYRWNEDGMGGVCDSSQRLCLAFAFWNGRDRMLKERVFGLTGPEGNHGEDAKEYWWYLDSTPTHSWMRWRYVYPQGEYPYEALLAESRRRTRDQPEYELMDTGVLDGGYWDVVVDYAKASPDDMCIRVRVRNAGPRTETLHLLPTLWFRNRWSWGAGTGRPLISADGGRLLAHDVEDGVGRMCLAGGGSPEPLFCDNETNDRLLWDAGEGPAYPKDGINDHVLTGAPTVNPDRTGTRAALWYRLEVAPGETAEVRLRLAPEAVDLGAWWEETMAARQAEADAFYAAVGTGTTPEEAVVMRQAFAGMLWTKQFYHYDVAAWMDGDPGQPPPPAERHGGRNAGWRHVSCHDVISMPDTWEYPWFAAWDLAFHCVALAHVDPAFAKSQLLLLTREWYMHPNGQLPAYEWNFSDVNPPVHAWAALHVFLIDGAKDVEFLERVFHKLLLNFTWWVNRKDAGGNNLFEGGFLGMDNIGPFDRSAPLPAHVRLEQSDGTGWMAMYCANMLEIALVLAQTRPVYEDLAVKFFEHFSYVAAAINDQGLWDAEDGFYYDRLRRGADATELKLRIRSMVGVVPMYAVATPRRENARIPGRVRERAAAFLRARPEFASAVSLPSSPGGQALISLLDEERLGRILERLLSEEEFLSPHGLRSLSAAYREAPYDIWSEGRKLGSVGYEPAESRTVMFGGNSNWRGPIWFPVNWLAIEALLSFDRFLGDDFTAEHPVGSGRRMTLRQVARDLQARLISLFLPGEDGVRPAVARERLYATDPSWADMVPFHEYFDGDTGAGLGASHQTGWTGLVADIVVRHAAARAAEEPTSVSTSG